MTNSERIGHLMHRYLRNKLSASEEKELDGWRFADPENEAFFVSTTNPEYLQEEINGMFESKEIIYNQLREEFPGYFPNPPAPVKKQPWIYRMLPVAAIYTLVLGSIVYKYYFSNEILTKDLLPGTNQVGIFDEKGIASSMNDASRGYSFGWAGITWETNTKGETIYHATSRDYAAHDLTYKLYTAGNGQLDLRLSDGTRIFLNGNSTVTYPRNLSQDSLKISIEGEAWLEIPKTNHHVLVFTKNTIIEAPGGKLDVEAYPDDSMSRITMVAGSARVLNNPEQSQQPNKVDLEANQELVSSGKKMEVGEARNISETIAWKDGRIHFTNASAQTIMRTIEHSYGVHVEYRGKITDQKFSLDIPRETKLDMVSMKLYLRGLHNFIEGNTIIVSQN